ncbi:MAG: hypothetical protein IID28_12220 [Planctomycetes bacterium]|nr:hypothetical protein [Planctomycetota bacterium]
MARLHRRTPPTRRGIALMDVILGGVMLGIGLTVVISLASRSMTIQAHAQKQLTAAWLVDELLAMVLVEGPVNYPKLYSTSGRFDFPFEDYEYDVVIEDIGLRQPFRVTAYVRWPHHGDFRQAQAQTYIAERLGDPTQVRIPLEPIDRIGRYYDALE